MQRFSLTLFGLVNFMILIRSFTHEQMGTWALFLIITTVFEMSKTNLLKNAHIRFSSGTEDRVERASIASSALLINIGVTLIFTVALLLFSIPLSRLLNAGNDLATMLQWFIPGLLCMIFFSHFESVQQSFLDFKGVFAGYFARQVSFFLVILIHYWMDNPLTLVELALYQSGSILIGTVVLFLYTRKYLLYRFIPQRLWLKRIFGYGGFIFSSGLIANLYSNLDQLMTAAFLAPASVAFYNAAARINQLVDIPSYAASEILFPKMAEASHQAGSEKVRYLYERMVAILLCFTVPVALVILLLPKFVISVLAGPGYEAAALILQLYMVTGFFRPMQNQAANLLNSIGKPGLCFTINTISLIVNLAVNYACLSYFGFYGAAIGTLITSVVGSTIWYFVIRREIGFTFANIFQFAGETYRMVYQTVTGFFLGARRAAA